MPPESALDWVVFKVAQRCNLNCTYCYVYNRGDDTWRRRPPQVGPEVVDRLSRRIAEQCAKYGLRRFTVELHGGEPLLLGKERMQAVVDGLRAHAGDIDLVIVLQTNGLLLDEEWLALFERNDITFGLSLDGPPEIADRRRVRLNGRGSTEALLRKVDRLRAAGPLFERLCSGVLCVIDPATDGGAQVRWFVGRGFYNFDFLLPDGTYVNPPQEWSGSATCAPFLLGAFDAWYAMGPCAPRIRTFETMMMGLLRVTPELDAFGGDLRRLCVVESDGAVGVIDTIRICGGRFAEDLVNVFDHGLDAHAASYDLSSIQVTSERCQECRYFNACRGGYIPHRFDGTSFANPSIHCGALYALAEHMVARMNADLPPRLVAREAAP